MKFFAGTLLAMVWLIPSQAQITQYSQDNRTPEYAEVISYYKSVAASSSLADIQEVGMTDAGYPLHTVILDADGDFDPGISRTKNKTILLINNGIHPGEPDGIDACIQLVDNWVSGKQPFPDNVVVVIIPVYNIGGALNRSSHSRANQNGPQEYGFRGNARNYDLNRDFIKQDTRNARSFAAIFQHWHPDIFIDTHVSNGADYQHVMTLVPTQHDKLMTPLGTFLTDEVSPYLYDAMEEAGFPMCPYVNTIGESPESGIVGFMDHPRYSTGYAALFNTIGFMTETHMLKPYDQRVQATKAFITSCVSYMTTHSNAIIQMKDSADILAQKQYIRPIEYVLDTGKVDSFLFKGYTAGHKLSQVSGAQRLYYDRDQPWEANIPLYDHYKPKMSMYYPEAWILPFAWEEVTERLLISGVKMHQLQKDSTMTVEFWYIDSLGTGTNSYEGHFRHQHVTGHLQREEMMIPAGSWYIDAHQPARRFLMEVLEPVSPDSYFSWNFFDPILMQKEWYSPYVFEDIAAELLRTVPGLSIQLSLAMQDDPSLKDPQMQLYWVYKHSDYFEKTYMRYPVMRVVEI